MLKKIMITGASGFVGKRLIVRLQKEAGTEVICAGRTEVANFINENMDLSDVSSIDDVVSRVRPDFVFHLAAQSSVVGGNQDRVDCWQKNAGATAALAAAISRYSPECGILFSSSAEVYGGSFNRGEAVETTCPEPLSSYASSKLAGELALRTLLPSTAQILIVRPSNHTGLGQSDKFALPSFARQIIENKCVLVGNIEAQRDFMHVEDVVSAYVEIYKSRHILSRNETFNVSSNEVCSIASILDRMIYHCGKSIEIIVDPSRLRPNDVPIAQVSSSKLMSRIGWQSKYTKDDIVQELLLIRRVSV